MTEPDSDVLSMIIKSNFGSQRIASHALLHGS